MLKQVNIDNAAEADYIFSMLMGEDVGPRREFIEENATYAKQRFCWEKKRIFPYISF